MRAAGWRLSFFALRITDSHLLNYKVTNEPLRDAQFPMLLNITVLPGDGIGPEVTEQAVFVLQALADRFGHQLQLQQKLIGGAAIQATNDPLPSDTVQACLDSSAVLLGAVGSPEFD